MHNMLKAAALLALTESSIVSAAVVGLDFVKSHQSGTSSTLRRRGTVLSALGNGETLYYANITIGTPAQDVTIQIDTGSSDLWVPASNGGACKEEPDVCEQLRTSFKSSKSSTFDVQSDMGSFNITYVDGTGDDGVYFKDTMSIGDAKITDLIMGLASDGSDAIGVMGIGYKAIEAIVATDSSSTYNNLPYQMKAQGLINTVAYSLWLNDLESMSGSILFGGIDTDKYEGSLVALPIQPDSDTGTTTSFSVAWTSLSVTTESQESSIQKDVAIAAVLDSGTTNTILPDDIAEEILQSVGAVDGGSYGNVVPCSIRNYAANFTYGFGGSDGPRIVVPISNLVMDAYDEAGYPLQFDDGTLACAFGIAAADGNPVLFGDTFLRSAYVVYDLENNQVAIAQTKYNVTSSNIKEFTGKSIPDVSSTVNSVTVTQTATGVPHAGAGSTATGTGGLSLLPGIASITATSTANGAASMAVANAKFSLASAYFFVGMISSMLVGGALVIGL